MKIYFKINYEFDKNDIFKSIEDHLYQKKSNYICVADGVVLTNVHKSTEYENVVNSGMFSICDSGFVPLYLRWIYNTKYKQYCGSDIFIDIINQKKYRMLFLGGSKDTLQSLQIKLSDINDQIKHMIFLDLPFCDIEAFDYPNIAKIINEDEAEIIWIALGAPKQEIFMYNLKPYLNKGIMIAVGAVFNFYSSNKTKRAPLWMIKYHLEFIYRILSEPKKQIKRCLEIIHTLPKIIYNEIK